MKRKTVQIMTAGVGIAAIAYVLSKAWRNEASGTLPYGHGRKLKRSIDINRTPAELYDAWRNIGGFGRLFDDFLSVSVQDQHRSHWALRAPGGIRLNWDAEITVDRPHEMIGWRSLEGSQVDNAGSVRFEAAPTGRATTVTVALQYNPPTGNVGAALASLVAGRPELQIEEALRRFKESMERTQQASYARRNSDDGPVEIASEDSFPASDAPAWTGTTGPV